MKVTEKMVAKLLKTGIADEWNKYGMHRVYINIARVNETLDTMPDSAKRHARLPLNRFQRNNLKIWIDPDTLEIKTAYISISMDTMQSIMEALEDLTAEPEAEETEDANETKKLWYAVLASNEEHDCGLGSFDLAGAKAIVAKLRALGYNEAYIAVIDANYDANGRPTTDGECVEEIRDF